MISMNSMQNMKNENILLIKMNITFIIYLNLVSDVKTLFIDPNHSKKIYANLFE